MLMEVRWGPCLGHRLTFFLQWKISSMTQKRRSRASNKYHPTSGSRFFAYLLCFEKLFETSPKRPGETLAGSCVQIATAVRPISNVSTSWSIIVIVPQTRGAVSRVCGKGAMQEWYIKKIRILHHFRFARNNLALHTWVKNTFPPTMVKVFWNHASPKQR